MRKCELNFDKCQNFKFKSIGNRSEYKINNVQTIFHTENFNKLFSDNNEGIKNRVPVIGVFVNAFDNRYEPSIWEGMKKGIKDYNCKLVCFTGGSINNPYYDNTGKNRVYNLAANENVDGIISFSSSISSFIRTNTLENFLSLFKSIPILNLGVTLKNMSSIVIDNEIGMEKLVTHLIEAHRYSRIAIICGPENNRDSYIRFNVYKKVLKKYNIPIDPDLIVKGEFSNIFGEKAVSILLDERKVKFDAIIGSNDFTAINAIKELTKRGFDVPGDIAVVGFDDVIESKFLKYPLTTVHQPCFDIGYLAVKNMLTILSGKKNQINQRLKSRLALRMSCGCNLHNKDLEKKKKYFSKECINYENNSNIKYEYIVTQLENIMKKSFKRICIGNKISKWAKNILYIFKDGINNYKYHLFFKTLKKIINISLTYKIKPEDWYKVIFNLFNVLIPELKIKNDNAIQSMSLKTMKMISRLVLKKSKYPFIESNDKDGILLVLKKKLQTVFEMEKFKEYTYTFLAILGIKNFFVVLNNNKCESNIIAGYKNYNKVKVDNNELFSSDYIIPQILNNNDYNTIQFVFSLYYNNKIFGHVLYEIENNTSRASEIYSSKLDKLLEFITEELNTALNGIMLYKNIKKQTDGYNKKLKIESSNLNDYRNFNLPDNKAKEYFRILLDFMESVKPYKNPELTLIELSELVGISRNHLSYIINVYSGVNFYDFINSYRLNIAKKFLLTKDYKNNMLDIAFDSGFKSKSTFNKIFKKFTNMTPSEFRKNNLQILEN